MGTKSTTTYRYTDAEVAETRSLILSLGLRWSNYGNPMDLFALQNAETVLAYQLSTR